jgi:hypothetical protein
MYPDGTVDLEDRFSTEYRTENPEILSNMPFMPPLEILLCYIRRFPGQSERFGVHIWSCHLN